MLIEEGLLEEIRARTLMPIIALQCKQAMKEEKITQSALAKKLNIGRAAIKRILDAKTSIKLNTLTKLTNALNIELNIHLTRKMRPFDNESRSTYTTKD